MLESRFQKNVIDFLKSKGFIVYNEQIGNGGPDLFVGNKKGSSMIELKVDSPLKPHQALKISNLRKKGVNAFAFKHGDNGKDELLGAIEGNMSLLVINHDKILKQIDWR